MDAQRSSSAGLPPGPTMPPLLQSASWVFRPVPYLERCRAQFGDTFTMQLAGLPKLVILSNPSDIKEVFLGDPNVFHAGSANVVLRPILGRSSLLLLERRSAHAGAPPDDARVPRRADAGLRARDARRRRSVDRALADGRRDVLVPPRDAGDHARRDPPRGVRRRGRRDQVAPARSARAHALVRRAPGAPAPHRPGRRAPLAGAPRSARSPLAVGELQARHRRGRRAPARGDPSRAAAARSRDRTSSR